MNPVELLTLDGTLVLRARGSELLILSHYIVELKKLSTTKDFAEYFMQQALINRPARKLFEAWLRKDRTLWKRIYNTVMNEIEIDDKAMEAIMARQAANTAASQPSPKQLSEPTPIADEAVATTKESAPKKKAAEKTTSKKAAAKSDADAPAKPAKKKAATKTAKKKAAAKTATKTAKKKTAAKTATKTAKKKTAAKTATKTAKKKTAAKTAKKKSSK